MKKQFGFARKMGQFGNKENTMDHVNNPMDAAFLGGHSLNESYKIPAANEKNQNHSYHHPLVDPTRENAPTKPKMVFAKVTGKNKISSVTPVTRGQIT
jgi:hypothetical protein